MSYPIFRLGVPGWVSEVVAAWSANGFASVEARMQFVIELSRLNVHYGGGPFGAAVFEADSGVLIAPGVNQVVNSHCSLAHAEVVALAVAQQLLKTHDLGTPGTPRLQLVSSTEPCLQCMGALLWSGVVELVCGARGEDAEAIGFDEGPKRQDWAEQLQSRGVLVTQDILRDQAKAVLNAYAAEGRSIYNATRS